MRKNDIIEKALELGFEDIGFTTIEPFESQNKILESRKEEYAFTLDTGLNLRKGLDPKNIMPNGESIIVLLDVYFKWAYPTQMEGYFGRCYMDDDRIIRDQLYNRVKEFRSYLRDNGIDSRFAGNIPHRLTAARAGLGTYGKNNFLYSRKAALNSSWISPIPLIVDYKFEPDEPTDFVGCPSWCKNTCISSCPTGALRGPRNLDPRKCISYLSYYQVGITPLEFREPMGTWVYGCDRCQEVCPRNRVWLSEDLPPNERVKAKMNDFDLTNLLHMDQKTYQKKVWPHMFYMSFEEIWRWKMNTARAMGNTHDLKYIPELIRAFEENEDERVKGMIAWALGRLGGEESKIALEQFKLNNTGSVKNEIEHALNILA
ncbi:MAG: epoxyqueuosine reductase [Promethearchaeota archaeon]|jgi:epoxyqueuosine reductase